MSLNSIPTDTGLATDTTINVVDPFSAGFERAHKEQLQKEFKEGIEPKTSPQIEGVSLEEDPSISVKKAYTLGEGLDTLVEGLSQEQLKKKRAQEAKERAKYIPYTDDIYAEAPTVNLNALQVQPESTSLADQVSRALSIREKGTRLGLLGTEDEESGIKLDDLNIKSSWLRERYKELADSWKIGKTAYSAGEDIYGLGKDAWNYFYGDKESYLGEAMRTTAPAAFGQYIGAGAGLEADTYAQPFATGLGTKTTQASVGIGAPTWSLAGQAQGLSAIPPTAYGNARQLAMGLGTGLARRAASDIATGWTGTGYGGLEGEATTWFAKNVPSMAGISKLAGSALAIYNVAKTFREGAGGQAKFNAIASTVNYFASAGMGGPLAIIQGLQTIFSHAMSRRGKVKVPFGGTEFKTEGNKLTFKHPYGYNGFNGGIARVGAASVSDYINTMTDYFGQAFYAPAWKQAVAANPRMGRYDTMNDSGYADLGVLVRTILEAPGVIQRNPTVNGQPITTQKQYEKAMVNFNDWYTKTARDRGGLVNAQWLNTQEEPNMFGANWAGSHGEVPSQIHFKKGTKETSSNVKKKRVFNPTTNRWTTQYGTMQTTGRGSNTFVPTAQEYQTIGGQTGDEYLRIDRWTEDVTSPYDILYYNITGKFNRGVGGMGY